MSEFAKRLKEKREENKISQRALAGFIGVSHSSVSQWESEINIPTIESLIRLCKILKVSADYLLGLTDFE